MVTRLSSAPIGYPQPTPLGAPDDQGRSRGRGTQPSPDDSADLNPALTPQQSDWLARQSSAAQQGLLAAGIQFTAPDAGYSLQGTSNALINNSPVLPSQPVWQPQTLPPQVSEAPPLATQAADALETVAMHLQNETLTSQAIVRDLQQTANLLGAPDVLRQQLDDYLALIDHEVRQPSPDTPLIEASLRRAAQRLDGHVTEALGQPSTVVGEWVEALLQQPIAWPVSPDAPPLVQRASVGNTAPQEQLPQASMAQQRQQLAPYYQAIQDREWAVALDWLNEQWPTLETTQPASTLAKLLEQRPKLLTKADAPAQSIHTAYEQATQFLGERNLLPQAQQVSLAHARWLQGQHQFETANHVLEQALQWLPPQQAVANGQPPLAQPAQVAHELGILKLQLGQPQAAVGVLQQALQAEAPLLALGGATGMADVYHHLALAYQRTQQPQLAESAYKESLGYAKQGSDVQRYKASLRQLASLYVEQGQTSRAAKLFNYL